jgi:hypothetical protein
VPRRRKENRDPRSKSRSASERQPLRDVTEEHQTSSLTTPHHSQLPRQGEQQSWRLIPLEYNIRYPRAKTTVGRSTPRSPLPRAVTKYQATQTTGQQHAEASTQTEQHRHRLDHYHRSISADFRISCRGHHRLQGELWKLKSVLTGRGSVRYSIRQLYLLSYRERRFLF